MNVESQRVAYGEELAKLGEKYKDLVVLDADLSTSTHTYMFGNKYPDRFFNLGIDEQNMMGMAAGLALSGKLVFASTFAIFATGRAYDLVRQSIAYNRANVKIVVTHAGLTLGEDGATHQMLEDISLMCGLPGMTVIAPADAPETRRVIHAVTEMDGPCYVRLSREKVPSILEDRQFKIGKGIIVEDGADVSIFSTGITLNIALQAREELKKTGVSAAVLHMPTIKPIDKEMIITSAKKTGRVITVEEHSIYGGLGSRIAEVLGENYPARLQRIAVRDKFGESGKGWELLEKYGISSNEIVRHANEMMG
jgi:transketolase